MRSSRAAGTGLALAAALALLLVAGCASTPEAPDAEMAVLGETLAAKPESTFYFPLESVTVIEMVNGRIAEQLLELRFDRPGAWSISPERFLLKSGIPSSLSPLQTYGSAHLKRGDIVIMRLETGRNPGYRQGNYGGDFFDQERSTVVLPEALIFINPALIDRTLFFEVPDESRMQRRGLVSIDELRRNSAEQIEPLSSAEEELIDEILNLGAAAGSRRGYRSIIFIPQATIDLDPYPNGIDLVLELDQSQLRAGSIQRGFSAGLQPRLSAANPAPEIRIGDLGVFVGATPLLDPQLPKVSSEIYRSSNLVKIGTSNRLRPSVVLWEGSFNAYRDERRRFLFYPGIFAYIPGQHPDLSHADVKRVTGMDPDELDRALKGRSLLTMRRSIYGAIPAFIAAAESPTELEIAFQSNPRLRDSLRDFLEEPAYFIWLD